MREYSQLTEQQRVALRGRAQLGEVTTAVLRLKESKQFKVGFFSNFFNISLIFDLLCKMIWSNGGK